MNLDDKLRILSITYGFVDKNRGTPIRILSLIKGLATYPDIELHTASLDTHLSATSTSHIILPKGKLNAIFFLYRYVKKNKIDVLIGHTLVSYSLLLPLKLLTRKKIVLEMHGFLEEEGLLTKKINFFSYFVYKFKHALIYWFFDLITTCSDTATDILRKHNNNVVTVFGGCDTKFFNPEIAPKFSFKESNQDVVIGYAGNTRVWQGLDFLLDTFIELNASDKRFKLALLLSEVHKIDPLPGVSLVPGLEYSKVPEFLASCDILIIPRLRNRVNEISFPSKLPEYLAMGKPVIASITSDSFRIITDGVNGVLFTPGDKVELKEKIKSLVDIRVREKIGRNARQISQDELCWEQRISLLHKELLKFKKERKSNLVI